MLTASGAWHCRLLARRMVEKAEAMSDAEDAAIMLGIAANYVRLAEWAEKRASSVRLPTAGSYGQNGGFAVRQMEETAPGIT